MGWVLNGENLVCKLNLLGKTLISSLIYMEQSEGCIHMLIQGVGGLSPYRRRMCTRGSHGRGDPTRFPKRNPLWSKYLCDSEVNGTPWCYEKLPCQGLIWSIHFCCVGDWSLHPDEAIWTSNSVLALSRPAIMTIIYNVTRDRNL
jgi:hypothetical protein